MSNQIAKSINLIDPNKVNNVNNTDDLYIYVDLTAESRGNTVFNIKSKELSTMDSKSANLMGYKDKTKIFTTDYTEVYNQDGTSNVFEGFGIENIRIVVNSSYVPTVTISFVDIKGMSFFNKGTDSPYSVLTMFPPPLFKLKVKGYYGSTLEYKLHLLKYNTKFSAETGNFNIVAEFVGNTFAPLADILFRHVLEAPFLDSTKERNVDKTSRVSSTIELISRSRTLNNKLTNFYNNERSMKFNERKEKIEILKSAITTNRTFDKDSLDEYGVTIAYIGISPSTTLINPVNSINLSDLDKEYYIISRISSTSNNAAYIDGDNTRNYFINYFISNEVYSTYKAKIDPLIKIIDVTNDSGQVVKALHINPVINELTKIRQAENDSIKLESKEIINEINNITYKTLGFNPTIYNVFEIICNDVDVLFNRLSSTYNESIDYMNANSSKRNRLISKFNNRTLNTNKDDIFIYPFPDIIGQDDKKTYPEATRDSDLMNMPENKLINDFVSAFINISNRRKGEMVKADINVAGAKKWIPNNVNDSTIFESETGSPYVDLYTTKDILFKLINRYIVLTEYTYGRELVINNDLNTSGVVRNKLMEFISKSEAINLVLSLRDPKLINNLIIELDKISSESYVSNFSNYFKDFTITRENSYYEWGDFSSLRIVEDFPVLGILTEKNKDLSQAADMLKTKFKNIIFQQSEVSFSLDPKTDNDMGVTLDSNNILYYHDGKDVNKTNFIGDHFFGQFKNELTGEMADNLTVGYGSVFQALYDEYLVGDKHDREVKLFIMFLLSHLNNSERMNILKGFVGIIMIPKFRILQLINSNGITKPVLEHISLLLKTKNISSNYITKINEYWDSSVRLINNISSTDRLTMNNYYTNNVDEYFSIYSEIFSNLKKMSGTFTTSNIKKEFKKPYFTKHLTDAIGKKVFITINSIYFKEGKIINRSERLNTFNSASYLKDNRIFIQKFLKTLLETSRNELLEIAKQESEEFIKITSTNIDNYVKQEIYYSFKNIVDRWFTSALVSDNKLNTNYNFGVVNNENSRLIDYFTFIDRASNDVGRDAEIQPIIDVRVLAEFEDNFDVNVLSVMSKILGDNGFQFYPLQNFMAYKDGSAKFSDVFKTMKTNSPVVSAPRFTCMYIGGTSSYVNNSNANYYMDDGIDFSNNKLPNDISNSENVFAFKVAFGENDQSIFSGIEMNTEEHQPTNESLKVMSQILDGNNNETTPLNISQNLFSVLEQRSYVCKIDMMGNAMIQPTQFFQLENVPLFRGGYIILNVEHNIDGSNNSMTTSFSGVRVGMHEKPFITNGISGMSNDTFEAEDNKSQPIQTLSEPSDAGSFEYEKETERFTFDKGYRISKYLTYENLIRTSHGENEVNDYNIITNAKNIGVNIYDPIHELTNGNIVLNSFYRSRRVNTVVGGSDTSKHMTAEAIDIKIADTSNSKAVVINGVTISNNLDLMRYIVDNFEYNQIISEQPNSEGIPKWIHIAYLNGGDNNRKDIIPKSFT